MKKINKNDIVNLLKEILLVAIIIFVATFLQFYWSMGHLSDRMSSACLECWFVEDAVVLSSITAIFLAIIFRFLKGIDSRVVRIFVQYVLLVMIWLYWDYAIFVDRESSWSTYLFKEELYYVASSSFLPVLMLSFLVVFLINYKYSFKNIS